VLLIAPTQVIMSKLVSKINWTPLDLCTVVAGIIDVPRSAVEYYHINDTEIEDLEPWLTYIEQETSCVIINGSMHLFVPMGTGWVPIKSASAAQYLCVLAGKNAPVNFKIPAAPTCL
jgi:hypothetical protein